MNRFKQTDRVMTTIDEKLSFLFREKGDRGRAIGIMNDLVIGEARKILSVILKLRSMAVTSQDNQTKL